MEANTTIGPDVIALPAGTYALSIPGAGEDAAETGDLDINDAVTIWGAGEESTIIDGGGLDRVFQVFRVAVEISGLTVRNGSNSGIWNGGELTLVKVSVENNSNDKIVDNTERSEGGGITSTGGAAALTLIDSTVRNNTSLKAGGGIANVRGVLTLHGSTVSGNLVSGDEVGVGGGIFNWLGKLTLNGSTVSGNQIAFASPPGRGVGGGIHTAALGTTITDSVIVGNSASGGAGGGIYAQPQLTLVNSIVSGNEAERGGGIFMGCCTGHDVTGSVISGNEAHTGGGIYIDRAPVRLTTSTISGNSAISGGGIHNTGTLTVVASTITQNISEVVAGLQNRTGGSAEISNTIISGNSPGVDCGPLPLGPILEPEGGSVSSLGYNLDSDGWCGLTQPTDIPNVDALLGPLQDNGGPTETHALLPGSPALDAGGADCPTTDQRGVVRPQGSNCDIGAFEMER